MRTPRWLATCMLLLGVLALAAPAVTVASGGGSAGDQQYTDPFAGTAPGKTKSTTTSAPATSTAPAAASPTTTSAAPATSTVAGTQTTSSDPTTPTATIATSTAGQLPLTGYDSWVAVAIGFVLMAGGLALRARLRRS